jgi:NhaP-type Na+/H+ or K+/H+ antiporter
MFELSIVATLLFAVGGFALFFIVVRRVMRFALRVALIGALALALITGALVWWFFGASGDSNSPRSPARARPGASPR